MNEQQPPVTEPVPGPSAEPLPAERKALVDGQQAADQNEIGSLDNKVCSDTTSASEADPSEIPPIGDSTDLSPVTSIEESATDESNEDEPAGEELARDPPPRIYAASLSDYNNGILHGTWIDADPDPEVMAGSITQMLAGSPTARRFGEPAEEWAIHDFEGFGDLRLSEYESLEHVSGIAAGITKHGPAFTAWIAHTSPQADNTDELLEQFADRFHGEWESVEAYADNMLDDLEAARIIDQAPEWLQPYLKIDTAGFARDLELGGDITTAETPTGGVWVWSGW